MDRKILILDIDGTLVNSKKEITDKTREALISAQKKGHIVALASGRPYPGMKQYIEKLELERYGGYAFAFNGGMVVNCSSDEVVYSRCIDKKYLSPIYEYALANNLGMVTYRDDEVVTGTRTDDYMEYEARLNFMKLIQVDNFLEYVDFDAPKCLLTSPIDVAYGHEMNLKKMLAPELNVFRSEEYFIEITHRDVDKAKSIDGFIKKVGIRWEDTICCGDGFNDKSMVSYANIGVAMGNAQQVVKDVADFVTGSCDDDGLVTVVEKYL